MTLVFATIDDHLVAIESDGGNYPPCLACGGDAWPVSIDRDGQDAEYRCEDCGECFVDECSETP